MTQYCEHGLSIGEYKWIDKCADVYTDEKSGYQNSFNHPSHFLLLFCIQRQEREREREGGRGTGRGRETKVCVCVCVGGWV